MHNSKVIALLIVALFVCFTTCTKKGSTGPGEPKLYVVGGIERDQYYYYPDTFTCSEDIFVSNAGVVPSVMINDQELKLDIYGNEEGFNYEGDFLLMPGLVYRLIVTSGSKRAMASVNLPGDFSIIAPDSSYVLPKGSSLDVSWGSASYASCYRMYLYIHYDYRDTFGDYQYFYLSIDTIVSGPNVTFKSNFLFPNLSEIDTIIWGYGHFLIYAIDGPVLVPGSVGNVTGDGIGFFWAQQSRFEFFHVGSSSKISEDEFAKRKREVFKKQKALWEQRIERLQRAGI